MYKILISKHFKKQLKSLVRKDKILKDNLKSTLMDFDKLQANSLGSSIYKIRLKSKNKGKSGGYGLLFFLMEIEGVLTPISIYAKSNKENISDEQIANDVNKVKEELENLL